MILHMVVTQYLGHLFTCSLGQSFTCSAMLSVKRLAFLRRTTWRLYFLYRILYGPAHMVRSWWKNGRRKTTQNSIEVDAKTKESTRKTEENWMEGIKKVMNEINLNEGQWENRKQWSLGVGQRRKTFWNRYIYIYIYIYMDRNAHSLTKLPVVHPISFLSP